MHDIHPISLRLHRVNFKPAKQRMAKGKAAVKTLTFAISEDHHTQITRMANKLDMHIGEFMRQVLGHYLEETNGGTDSSVGDEGQTT